MNYGNDVSCIFKAIIDAIFYHSGYNKYQPGYTYSAATTYLCAITINEHVILQSYRNNVRATKGAAQNLSR